MSLARAALNARPRLVPTIAIQRRPVSSNALDHAHEEHHSADHAHYAEGGFITPFWRNAAIFSAVVVAFYKFAPAPGEEVYLTQYLANFKTPNEVWASMNEKHVNAVTEASDGLLLQNSAVRPSAHRFRFPQRFDFVSPHLAPVGSEIDMTGVVAKGSHQ